MENRQGHGAALLTKVDQLAVTWEQAIETRSDSELPELPYPDTVPLFLQIDPTAFDIESLKGFGVEIIAEEENGYIIGAASKDFTSLRKKIENFLTASGKSPNKAAQLWEINNGLQWRVDQILSDELKNKWDEISDTQDYIVDVGIACYIKFPDPPVLKEFETDEKFNRRFERWQASTLEYEIARDEVCMDRQTKFENLISEYGGELLSGYEDFQDSFACRVKVSGKALKDIVLTFPYLFEVVEHDSPVLPGSIETDTIEVTTELIPPPASAPRVCIIDSGIQEGHRLLAQAIDPVSYSFVPGDASTADSVVNGGHGTRVAGSALYPTTIPTNGQHQLTFFIQNARVLSGTNGVLSDQLYPPILMSEIAARYHETKIFNLSITSFRCCRAVHMSQWASAIDKLMYEKGVIFVISSGNLFTVSGNPTNPGIKEHITGGASYPGYLYEDSSRLANPAQSSFAITVGSICHDGYEDMDKKSFGERDQPSSFSRAGLGLWGMIKPDVVEYGGDWVREKNNDPNLSLEAATTIQTVRSTLNGGHAIGKDVVGTSFSAPKVAHILAQLQNAFPSEPVNLYRALLVQSARLPEAAFLNPTLDAIKSFGYGVPNLHRALENSERRVTLVNSGSVAPKKANVYLVKIPEQMRGPAEDYDVLMEVTLAFMAEPRRTRRRTNSYLSTWLDWHSSKHNETHDQFCARILKNINEDSDEVDDQSSIKWVIRENREWSQIKGLRRQDSTLQKSWCTVPAYALPQELSIAVVGHSGWNKDFAEAVQYSVAVSFEVLNANVNIYEMIQIENEVPLQIMV
ncbi:MAG: S8 family peptidase [Flammeovirgaceae bacterium]|nr:S8 family peptidase [Flammeovirgaceae bacterium]